MDENGPKTEKKETWLDLVRFALISVAIVIPFRIFIAQPYIVEGSSMDPTFKNGDYLIVDQISYKLSIPERGEIAILKYPKEPSRFLIKRVMGLPGETVIIKSGKVSIRNKEGEFPIEEDYIRFTKEENLEFKLGDTEYFVMGDNRAGSSDSRIWGTVPEKYMVGKVLLRLFPFNSLGLLPGETADTAQQK